MRTIYSTRQTSHRGQVEFYEGAVVPGFEGEARAVHVLRAIEAERLGPVEEPADHGLDIAERIHSPRYLAFLQEAWDRWAEAGRTGTALPYAFCAHGQRRDVYPVTLDGRLAFHVIDTSTGFVAGTWPAVKASYDTALTAADRVAADGAACFALCRPPGHHAGPETAAGYCFINNAAAAAQRLLDQGSRRVAVLDIDYHHGNGTQQIFYARPDVLVVSLHADPVLEYPFFLGHADERGDGEGEGFNINLPLPFGTDWSRWSETLDVACSRIRSFQPDAMVVSLGVDIFAGDPISRFAILGEHFPLIGERLARMGLPTLFVMEGGYDVDAIGRNVVGVLRGFAGR